VFSKQISIHPLPVPGFVMPGNFVNDANTQFTDTRSIADGTAGQFTYLWNFGDQNANVGNPNSSIGKNASHKYIGLFKTLGRNLQRKPSTRRHILLYH
jgi:hypothetical protein